MAMSAATVRARQGTTFEPAVFHPGDWGERLAEAGHVVVAPTPLGSAIVTEGLGDMASHVFATQFRGILSRSVGSEAIQVATLFFESIMVRSMTDWNALYGQAGAPDPFDYKSVPLRITRMVRAKIRRRGPALPAPLIDD